MIEFIHPRNRSSTTSSDFEMLVKNVTSASSPSHVNEKAVLEIADLYKRKFKKIFECMDEGEKCAWMLRAVTCIDLTTLAGDDTTSNVLMLCSKARHPIRETILQKLGLLDDEKISTWTENNVRTAAVCVYPIRVSDACKYLKSTKENDSDKKKKTIIPVASVATGFPSASFDLKSRLSDVEFAIKCGATEIDIVIQRALVLQGHWEELYEEVKAMKGACEMKSGKDSPGIHLKAILAVGELGSLDNVYKASMVCMMAGADFIKTSTGKEAVNATIPYGIVMCRAISDFYNMSGVEERRVVGLKPAGGIKTSLEALTWLYVVKEELGCRWLQNGLFRIGASSLLDNIERDLFELAFKREPHPNEL